MTIDFPHPQQIPALRQLWKEAFGDTDAFLDSFFRTAFSPSRCRCITVEEQPASVLYWFNCEYEGQKIAYLYAVATKKSCQGRGLCRRLMEDTHRHLATQGYAGVILVPGSPSLFRFYEKIGYTTCCFAREFSCKSGKDPVPLRTVSPDEFARIRRALLPKGAVIQEAENLSFLQTQMILLAGDGILLAAYRTGHKLHVPELLGPVDAAPGILYSLGCTEGSFRTPGQDTPFAMYFPLAPGPLPSYLGFAFD